MTARSLAPAAMAGAPVAFAGVLLLHPNGGSDFADLVARDPTRWIGVHLAGALFLPLMALVVWRLVRGLDGRAARVARVALPVFVVAYGTWEALVGIAAGVMTREGGPAVAGAVNALATDPVVGELGVINAIGALAWLVAIWAAVVALRQAGVGAVALVPLALAALMVQHPPPVGPAVLVGLGFAAWSIERLRFGAAASRPRRLARHRPATTRRA